MEKAKEIFSLTDSSKAITFVPLNLEETTIENITTPIDFVIHLAAPTASKYFVDYPVETFLTVVEGTRQILDFACAKAVSRMVYVSSLEVYGTVTDDASPLTESCQGYIDPMDVRSSYSMGKRAAECLCHAYAEEKSLSVSTARLAQTFGARPACICSVRNERSTQRRHCPPYHRRIVKNVLLHDRCGFSTSSYFTLW